MDCFVARAPRNDVDKSGYDFAISRHDLPELCQFSVPRKKEGAGKTGCALHPRSRVQCAFSKSAHEHTGSAETLRPSLRNGFTAYIALSPATNSSCHRRQRINGLSKTRLGSKTSTGLTPATGARTTRFCRTRPRVRLARSRVHRSPVQRSRRS